MHIDVAQLRRISRNAQLAREQMSGRPRAKSWGGKPTNRQSRRQWKKEIAQ